MQQLMTVKEYAALKRISENTVRRLISAGALEVERFGRAIRIRPAQNQDNLNWVDLIKYQSNQVLLKSNKKQRRAK